MMYGYNGKFYRGEGDGPRVHWVFFDVDKEDVLVAGGIYESEEAAFRHAVVTRERDRATQLY